MIQFIQKYVFIVVMLLANSSVFSSSSSLTSNKMYNSFNFQNGTQYAATNLIIATLIFKERYPKANTTEKGEFIYDINAGINILHGRRVNPLLDNDQINFFDGVDKIKIILTPFYQLTKNQLIHIYNLVKADYGDGIIDQQSLKAVIVLNQPDGDTSYQAIDNSYLIVQLFQTAFMRDKGQFKQIKQFINQLP
jgi:hypothetical protein